MVGSFGSKSSGFSLGWFLRPSLRSLLHAPVRLGLSGLGDVISLVVIDNLVPVVATVLGDHGGHFLGRVGVGVGKLELLAWHGWS